jgi:hypothetical protein
MHEDFIELYENALTPAQCAALIAQFDASGEAVRGQTGGGLDLKLKDSWDITISGRPQWLGAERALSHAMLVGLVRYVRRYPYVVLAPLHLKRKAPDGSLAPLDLASIAAMNDGELQALVMKVFRPGGINLQKYTSDVGGYPYWHCELYPKADNGDTLHRTLLWSVYLNENFSAGETEFLHQQRKIAPQTGALLFAPAAFTHTHRGNRPEGGDKYIATSWVLFQRADALYGNPAA